MSTETDNGNITVFGAKNPQKQPAETTATSPVEQGAAEQQPSAEKNQGTDNITVIGAKPQQQPKPEDDKVDDKAKTPSEEKKPENDGKPKSGEKPEEGEKPKAFAVEFKDDKKEEVTDPKNKEEKREAVSMSEESVLQFLKSQFPDAFADVKGLSELARKEELPEPVSAFNKFHKETGRGLKDFYNLQRDWSKESPESTLREYYKLTNEGLSEDDINDQLDLVIPNEDDEINLSTDDQKRKSIEFKKEHAKAVKFMQNKSEEYKTPLESAQSAQRQAPPTEAEIAKSYQPYWDARDKSLGEYNEFEFSVGIGDVKVPITEEMKKMIADRTQTDQTIFQPWIKDGKIDAKDIVENMAWAIPEVRKQLLAQSAEQINALSLEDFSKKNRNVTLDKIPEKAKERRTGALQVFGGDSDNRMGTPLM